MKNAFKYLTVIFAAALILSAGGVCRSDDSSQEIKTFYGQVNNIDWVGSLITVDGGYRITFYIPPGMKIRCGTAIVSLSDLHQGDRVSIRYVDDPTGTPKAVSVNLSNAYLEF